MKDGTILFIKGSKEDYWYEEIVAKAISFFTKSPFVHTLLYLNGKTYDWTMFKKDGKWFSGVQIQEGVPKYDNALEPNFDLNKGQIKKMEVYFKEASGNRYPYNVARLVILAIIYPTRWFWNLINWVPFSKVDKGEVCSTGIDEAFKAAGIDLIEGEEELTSPAQLYELKDRGSFKEI